MTSRTQPTERHVPRRGQDQAPEPKRQNTRKPTAKPQDTRRPETRRAREPAIWRGPDTAISGAERTHDHVEGRAFIRWRFVSGFVVLALTAVLGVFFVSDSFYIHSASVAVGGLETMTHEEVYQLAQIADTQIFWVNPEQVRRNLLQSPTIADAQVYVSWGMPMVQILIQERQPALVWQQGESASWIDVQGRVMEQRGARPDLLRVVVDPPASLAENPIPLERLSADVVNGALQLHELLPDAGELHYSVSNGLGFTDPRGWAVWFGTGTDMPEKVLIYNALTANLLSRGITPGMFNLINPDNPYYTARSGR